ncbi:MAG: hypothetical protein N2312_02105 [Dictyoglomaceae bacterium]|nr:hypothetical protein [Dictyoglomaceae bacterium]
MFDFYFIINGPGEISGWLYPLISWIKERDLDWVKNINFYTILVPCQFATGEEKRVLEEFNFFKEIISSNKYWENFIYKPKNKNIIFHLGGDLFFNGVLGKIWRSFSIAYVEKKYSWLFLYKNIYSSKDLKDPKIKYVGELRFENLNRYAFSKKSNRVALFPGSRDYALRFYLPFYLALIKEICKFYPELQFTIFLSQFLRRDITEKILMRLYPLLRDLPVEIEVLRDWKKQVNNFLFAITLPGTTTLQLGYSGIPMLVLLPLHRPEYLPMEGFANFIKGKVRNLLINIYLKKNSYLALPNKYKPGVVPEIIGRFDFKKVIKYILKIMDNRELIEKIHGDLIEIIPEICTYPSEIIWSDIYEILEKDF